MKEVAVNEERSNRRRSESCSGFTLIEVLLVVAILGILAAVVVVNVGGRREGAMISATRASIANLSAAIDLYEVDTGRYPPSLQSLISSDGAPNWSGPYIKSDAVPVDAWGVPFQYSKRGSSYTISSGGPDMTAGGEDDIKN